MQKLVVSVLGVDLGKNSCSVAGLDAAGAVVMRRRMTRKGLIKFISKLPECVVAMEACCGAHFGPDIPVPWAHGAVDVAGICSALCQGAEDRRPGC